MYHKTGQLDSSSHGAVVNFKLLSKWKIAIVVCFHFSVLFFSLKHTMNRIYWMLLNVTYSLHSLLSNRFSRRRGHTKNKMKNTHGSAGMEWNDGMKEWEEMLKRKKKRALNCLQSLNWKTHKCRFLCYRMEKMRRFFYCLFDRLFAWDANKY